MNPLQELTLEELDELLQETRRAALKKWPYTFDEQCRGIEAEYRRRRVALPEDRDALGRSAQ